VYETEEELEWLQALLDESQRRSGPHVRSIFGRERTLSARQVSLHRRGVKQVAFATVNSAGEPRVAPVDSAFFHGRFHISTDSRSFRAKNLRKRPDLSLTYFEGADPLIIVHGIAVFIETNQPEFGQLDSEWVKAYGKSTLELSDSVAFIRADPTTMLAYSFHPERFLPPGV